MALLSTMPPSRGHLIKMSLPPPLDSQPLSTGFSSVDALEYSPDVVLEKEVDEGSSLDVVILLFCFQGAPHQPEQEGRILL